MDARQFFAGPEKGLKTGDNAGHYDGTRPGGSAESRDRPRRRHSPRVLVVARPGLAVDRRNAMQSGDSASLLRRMTELQASWPAPPFQARWRVTPLILFQACGFDDFTRGVQALTPAKADGLRKARAGPARRISRCGMAWPAHDGRSAPGIRAPRPRSYPFDGRPRLTGHFRSLDRLQDEIRRTHGAFGGLRQSSRRVQPL
jgi:hypothetical protein